MPNNAKDKFGAQELSRSHDNGIREESRNVFYSWRCNLFEQSYNPKVIHTYRRPTETTRVVGFAKGNLLSRESSKTLKQDIPAAHLPHRGKSFGVCTELVERRLSKWERKNEGEGNEGERGNKGMTWNSSRERRP